MRKSMLTLLVVLSLCACSIPLTRRAPAEPSLLVQVACPPLAPLLDDTFGATTQALIDTSIQYRKCRAAALGVEP